jgi:hypothetical protein
MKVLLGLMYANNIQNIQQLKKRKFDSFDLDLFILFKINIKKGIY